MAVYGSPEYWRDKLVDELRRRGADVQRLERYYNGNHPLPSPPKRLNPSAFDEARRAYAEMMRLGVTNWVKLVADAPSERLEVVDVRSIEESGRRSGDKSGWQLWQEYDLDAQSILTHDNALQTGTSFVMVDPDSGAITCEHSGQMIAAYVPGSRREVAAALKMWDDGDEWMATLIMPSEIYKWSSSNGLTGWRERGEPTVNRLGVVPVVEFAANPSLRPAPYGGGVGEFETVLPIQDRINKTIFDRLVTAEFQAFRQRWIVGWSPEADETTGLPKQAAVQAAANSMLWTFDADPSEVRVGEFAQASFTDFIKAVESDVNAMAAISKTPPHYLLGAMVNISGDALTAAESGLSSKTRKHARNFGDCWERVIRLAARQRGLSIATDSMIEVVWGDIEHRSWGETVDATLKMQALGVPTEALWERLPDVSPQDVARWRSMSVMESLRVDPPAPDVVTEPADGAGV